MSVRRGLLSLLTELTVLMAGLSCPFCINKQAQVAGGGTPGLFLGGGFADRTRALQGGRAAPRRAEPQRGLGAVPVSWASRCFPPCLARCLGTAQRHVSGTEGAGDNVPGSAGHRPSTHPRVWWVSRGDKTALHTAFATRGRVVGQPPTPRPDCGRSQHSARGRCSGRRVPVLSTVRRSLSGLPGACPASASP